MPSYNKEQLIYNNLLMIIIYAYTTAVLALVAIARFKQISYNFGSLSLKNIFSKSIIGLMKKKNGLKLKSMSRVDNLIFEFRYTLHRCSLAFWNNIS